MHHDTQDGRNILDKQQPPYTNLVSGGTAYNGNVGLAIAGGNEPGMTGYTHISCKPCVLLLHLDVCSKAVVLSLRLVRLQPRLVT